MTDVETREATPDDWESWRDIRLRSLLENPDAFGSTHEREAAYDQSTWRSRLDGSAGPSILAYGGGTPVGMGAGWLYEPGRIMIVAMWTDPAWRGRGVGRSVLNHVVGWARRRGLEPELWVADTNPEARRLYESYGFRSDGETSPLRAGSAINKSRLVLPDPPAAPDPAGAHPACIDRT
ncbi:MAG TPA: GNAT family N-acetyltransferase [Nocardioidaceae bacterium]|nr:GNAT family N-acetyltransferase [Nocardioidaceae bacterium]